MSALVKVIRSQRTAQIAMLLVLACSVGLVIWSGNSLRYFDEIDYNSLAQSLLHRHAFAADGRLTLFRPPGYPFILAAIYGLVDSPLAAKLVNCLALVASTFLLARLSVQLYPSRTALVPLAVLCYPLFFYTASTLYPQTIGGLLLLAIILQLAGEHGAARSLAIAGVLVGALCLVIPSFLYILPLFGLYVMYQRRGHMKQMFGHAVLLGLIAALTIAPWTIRNAIEFHALVPISANSGFNLALGNSAFTPANRKTDLMAACPGVRYTPNEVEFDRSLTRCALGWMRANPGPALRLYVAKFFNYFNFRNELITSGEQKPWQEWLVFITYYPLLGLSLLRLAFWRRYRLSGLETLLYAIYYGNAALTAIFFTRLRFRIPFDLLLVAIDAAFVTYLLSARTGESAPSRPAPAETMAQTHAGALDRPEQQVRRSD
jgi:hypothetical protein